MGSLQSSSICVIHYGYVSPLGVIANNSTHATWSAVAKAKGLFCYSCLQETRFMPVRGKNPNKISV